MASALHSAYADLFKMYPDAYRKDVEALRDFFTGTTTGGAQVVKFTVDTFRALCEFADFEAPMPPPVSTSPREVKEEVPIERPPSVPGLVINLNIQLQLPATEDVSIYDKIFKSLKEHLLKS